MEHRPCKMCPQKTDLIRSHLIPRSVYDLCRTLDSEPVKVTRNVVMQTSRQTQDYLLCSKCDNHLNQFGENWVLPKLKRWNGGFPLHEILLKVPADVVIKEGMAYSASRNGEIDIKSITHFAVGIFWKASVHSWSKHKKEPRIELGPYSDRLRKFLLGEAPFPEHVMLNVGVVPPNVNFSTAIEPYQGSAKGTKNYIFNVPGVQFVLTVGKTIDPSIKETCFYSSPHHPIIVADFSKRMYEIYKTVTAKAHYSKKITEYLAKRKASAQGS